MKANKETNSLQEIMESLSSKDSIIDSVLGNIIDRKVYSFKSIINLINKIIRGEFSEILNDECMQLVSYIRNSPVNCRAIEFALNLLIAMHFINSDDIELQNEYENIIKLLDNIPVIKYTSVKYAWQIQKKVIKYDKSLLESIFKGNCDKVPVKVLLEYQFTTILFDISSLDYAVKIPMLTSRMNKNMTTSHMNKTSVTPMSAKLKGFIINNNIEHDSNVLLVEAFAIVSITDQEIFKKNSYMIIGLPINIKISVENEYIDLSTIITETIKLLVEDRVVKNLNITTEMYSDLDELTEKIFNLYLYSLCEFKKKLNEHDVPYTDYVIKRNLITKGKKEIIPVKSPNIVLSDPKVVNEIKRTNKEYNKLLLNESTLPVYRRSHIRNAHFHSYWIGSRKDDNRTLIVKWIPPILVRSTEEILTGKK